MTGAAVYRGVFPIVPTPFDDAGVLDLNSQRRVLDPASVPAGIRAEDHLMIGNYAVQFLWSDAHYTGIYPFKVLRQLCQCDQCKVDRSKG